MALMARSPVLAMLAIALTVAILSCGTCPPAPYITSISPSSATAGRSQFLLTVHGDNFRFDSVVIWNESFSATNFISSQQLVATIPATDFRQPGTVPVSVFNPPEGGTRFVDAGLVSTTSCSAKISNAISFTINDAAP